MSKKAPQDATLRNVRAANKQLVMHTRLLGTLAGRMGALEREVQLLQQRVAGLAPHAPPEPLGPELRPPEPWR